MPRIDLEMTADERARIISDLTLSIQRYTNRCVSHADWSSPWRYLTTRAGIEWEEVVLAMSEDEIGPRLANPATGRPCTCYYDYRYRGDGCIRCRPELWRQCPCGRVYHFTRGNCSCWVVCERCGTFGYFPNITYVDNSVFCSLDCAESAGAARCGYTDWDGDCTVYTRDETGLCADHRPCECGGCSECRDRSNIHSYSYKPTPRFRGRGPLYLGLECEISCRESTTPLVRIAEMVNRELENGRIGYLKSDSSINSGFEMVTHPMSYQWAMAEFPWHLFAKLTGEHGVSEDSSCGIHVHASRDGFSGPRHLYVWQKFFYRNAGPIQDVARRHGSRWARFSREARDLAAYVAKTGGCGSETVSPRSWYLPSGWRDLYRNRPYIYGPTVDRYSAINVQNRETVEVRVFAGSVEAQEVKAALGLVHSTIEYARILDTESIIKKKGWDWESFASWVSGREEYAALNSEIERLVTA